MRTIGPVLRSIRSSGRVGLLSALARLSGRRVGTPTVNHSGVSGRVTGPLLFISRVSPVAVTGPLLLISWVSLLSPLCLFDLH